MRIAVLGSGAMGGLFGARLSLNNDVTIVGRNAEVIGAINQNGLEVREPDGASRVYHPRAVASTEGMEPAELVLVLLKSMATEGALEAHRGLIGPETWLMTLQNGSGHEETLSRFAPRERIVIGTTQHNAAVTAPGVVTHGGSGMTYLGCAAGDAARVRRIAEAFTACGLEAEASGDVRRLIWNKLLTNVSVSALTGVLQVPMGCISRDEHAWNLCRTLIREAVDVAAALGMDFDCAEKTAEIKALCDNSPNGLTSIYADLRRGRRTEVDAISGSVVRAGKAAGVPTPCHEFMVELIHAMEDRTK